MKKSPRKLSLSRETLCGLGGSALGIAGAGKTNACPTMTAGYCDYTLGCTQEVCTTR